MTDLFNKQVILGLRDLDPFNKCVIESYQSLKTAIIQKYPFGLSL